MKHSKNYAAVHPKIIYIALAALITCILYKPSAFAEEASLGMHHKNFTHDKAGRIQRLLNRNPEIAKAMDANSDGEVSRAEFNAGREILKEHQLDRLKEKNPEIYGKLDANGDGYISAEEFQEGKHKRLAEKQDQWLSEHPEAAERLDRNGDGAVDRQEFRMGKKHLSDKGEKHQHKDSENKKKRGMPYLSDDL